MNRYPRSLDRINYIVLGAVLLLASCEELPKETPDPKSAADTAANSAATPASVDSTEINFADLLFADQTIDRLIGPGIVPDPYSDDWQARFAYIRYLTGVGREVTAKEELRKVLQMPNLETRVRLLAWKALRDLGERPPASLADDVQGMVLQVGVGNGVDFLAAYADGSARYINKTGAVVVWDGTNPKNRGLIDRYLASGREVVGKTRAARRGPLPDDQRLHVTALTFAGTHTIDFDIRTLDSTPEAAAAFNTGTELMQALLKEVQQQVQADTASGISDSVQTEPEAPEGTSGR